MKKYLLFVLMAVITVGFSGCSSDDEEPDDTNKPPVTSTTGAITKDGVNFSDEKLKCEEIVFTEIPEQKSVARAAIQDIPAYMILRFNDNVEVVFNGIIYEDDNLPERIYRILKNCGKGDITINFIENEKIVSTETFDAPLSDWWKMADDDSYFSLQFDFKGEKYSYTGQIKYEFK